MAVGFVAKGVGAADSDALNTRNDAGFDLVCNGGECIIAAISFSAADLALGPFVIGDNDLNDLSRKVTYGGVAMTSLGIVQWGTAQAWTEAFAMMDAPEGKHRVAAAVGGGAPSKRILRVSAAVYSNVDAVGEPVMESGTGTSMAISVTAAAADRVVGVFGSKSGLSGFANGTEMRYLENSGIGLLIGDAAATGSSQSVTGNRQKSGVWAGMAIPLLAADTIATCPPLVPAVRFGSVRSHREQRTGGLQRNVFTVEA